MRSLASIKFIFVLAWLSIAPMTPASAQCVVPNQITNGQTADATQVMANFNALVACLSAAAPAGSTNSLQYNAGSGAFGGVGPLTNGQVVIGSTGGVPQAQTLTAGSGVTITNAPGSITIASSGGPGGAGLYGQVMSPTPTSASTGLTNWINQGSAQVTDSPVGVSIRAPSNGNTASAIVRFVAAPTAPYTITALVAATRTSTSYNGAGIGWYDGSSKLHVMSNLTNNGGAPFFEVQKWNSATSWNSNDFASTSNAFPHLFWAQISDDGINVSFAFSLDGANFLTIFSIAKSSGFLGANGYNNLVFFVNPQDGPTVSTLMSWTQN